MDAKCDAVTAKKSGSAVKINTEGGQQIRIYGNIDASAGGIVDLNLDKKGSVWEGHLISVASQFGLLYYGKEFTLTLSNGGRWVPDAKNDYIGEYDLNGFVLGHLKSTVNLQAGGIIDLYGMNSHTNKQGYTDTLTIDNLQADGGRFIMDLSSLVSPEKTNDMLYIKGGNGTAYVEPVDPNRLQGVTRENPILFADAAEQVTFEGYDKNDSLEKGFLYNYIPIVDKDVKENETNKNGHNWYIVGVKQNETPAITVPVANASRYYSSATSFLALDDLNKRIGEVRDAGPDANGAWARVKAGRISSNAAGYFKDNYQFYQLGYDRFIPSEKGDWLVGAAFHHTEGNATFDQGSGDLDNTGLSGYLSWFNGAGWYADFVAKYSWLSDNYRITVGNESAKADFDSNALTLSAETGKRFELQKYFFVEPQIQLVYTRVDGVSYAMSNGISINQGAANSVIGRMGVRLGTTFAMLKSEKTGSAYLRLDGYHEFDGDRTIALQGKDSSYAKSINGSDSWMSYGVGVTLPFARHTSFYAEVERSAGGDIQTDWQVNGGLRIQF